MSWSRSENFEGQFFFNAEFIIFGPRYSKTYQWLDTTFVCLNIERFSSKFKKIYLALMQIILNLSSQSHVAFFWLCAVKQNTVTWLIGTVLAIHVSFTQDWKFCWRWHRLLFKGLIVVVRYLSILCSMKLRMGSSSSKNLWKVHLDMKRP